MKEKIASGVNIANLPDIDPFNPNCSKKIVMPINPSHKNIADPNVIAFPRLPRVRANGTVNRTKTKGISAVLALFSSATSMLRRSVSDPDRS